MNNRSHLLTTLLTAFLAAVATMAQEKPYLYKPQRIEVVEHGFIDTVAIRYEGGRVWVPVKIGGKEARFMLDTGAALSSIPAATSLSGIRPLGTISSATDANGNSRKAQVVALPEIEIGHIHLRQMPALLTPARPTKSDEPIEGVLGFALIARGISMRIDLEAGHIVLTDRRDIRLSHGGSALRYRYYLNTPEVQIVLAGGAKERAVLDTGSPHLMLLSAESLAKWQAEGAAVSTQVEATTRGQALVGAHGMEPKRRVDYLCLDPVAWGKVQLHSLKCITTPGHTSIGAPILEHCAITIEPHLSSITLEPYDGVSDISLERDYDDIYYGSQSDGRAYVSLVRPGSPQSQQGLRAGDVIVAINGTPIFTLRQLTRYPFVRGQAYTYTMRRGSITYEATLTYNK